MTDPAALDLAIRAVLARGDLRLTVEELAILGAAPSGHALAAKILAAHHFNRSDYETALIHARRSAELDPGVEAENNLVSTLARAGRIPEALTRVARQGSPLSEVQQATHMSELLARTDRRQDCVSWGRKALALKDAEAGPTPPDRADPVLHRFDVETPARNVISFSLFGTNQRYLDGALINARIAPHLYPGWTARFYVDDSLPDAYLQRLRSEGAQVLRVSGLPADRFGLVWRFLVEDDPGVDLFICRDADSIINIRERLAVQAWLDSGQPFHVMRDFPSHSELVLAGMWGAHRGNIGNMSGRLQRFDAARRNRMNDRAWDQLFLRRVIWPLMRERLCCHDAVFGFGATDTLPPGAALPGNRHVGQNHSALQRRPDRQ